MALVSQVERRGRLEALSKSLSKGSQPVATCQRSVLSLPLSLLSLSLSPLSHSLSLILSLSSLSHALSLSLPGGRRVGGDPSGLS